jgi:hypothetical protein
VPDDDLVDLPDGVSVAGVIWSRQIALLRFWLSQNTAALGIPLAVAVLALGLLGVLLLRPAKTGPAISMGGRVVSEVPPPDQQYYNDAWIVVELDDGKRITAKVPLTQTCRLGDRVVAARTPTGIGNSYTLERCAKVGIK